MLTIEQVRKTLPEKYKDLSDAEVEKLRDGMDQLANIIFDKWLAEKNGKKSSKQTSPSPETPSVPSPQPKPHHRKS